MARHAVQRSRTVLSLVAAGSAAALVAGILAVNGAATAAPKWSDNLVSNPDFESGTQGWNAQLPKTSLSQGEGHSGKRSGAVKAGVNGARLLLNDSPNVVRDTEKGDHFVASVWVRTDAKRLPVVLRFREVDGAALVGTAQDAAVVQKSGGWVQLSAEYVAAGTGHQIAIQVLSGPAAKGESMLVDDVDVRRQIKEAAAEEKPKPSQSAKPTESAKPAPTPSKSDKPRATEAPAASGTTLFGASVYTADGTSFETALARSNSAYGGMKTVRVFYPGMPADWPGKAGKVTSTMVVSFKAPPAQVLSGSLDSFFTQWFADAPRDRDVYWTNYHEPEDNIESGNFTAAQYRDAIRHLDALADKAGNPRLHTTTIWMCFTLRPGSGRDWHDYYPGSDVVDVMAWDCYNNVGSDKGEYYSPATLLDDLRAVSESQHKPWGLGEYGSRLVSGDEGSGRAKWLKDSAAYAREHDALWVNYFDALHGGSEYRLLDAASQAAWRSVVTGS